MTRIRRAFSPLVARQLRPLSLALAVLLLAGAAGSWLAIQHTYQRQIKAQISADEALLLQRYHRLKVVAVIEAIDYRIDYAPETAPDGVYLLIDQEGNHITGNLERMPDITSVGDWLTFDGDLGSGNERIIARITPVDDYFTLLVGRRLAPAREFQLASALALAIAGAAMFGLIFLVFYHQSRTVAKRFHLVTNEIEAARRGDRTTSAPETGDDEISALGAEINSLLDTLDRQLDHLRNMSKVIAHEIRTPLSSVRKALGAAIASDENPSEHVAAALEQTNGVLELANALLEITDNEAAHTRFLERLDLADMMRDIARLFEDVAAEKHVSVRLELEAAPILGGKWLLARLVSNLVENAINASASGQTVTCRTGADSGAAWFEICDEGAGIPAETLDAFLSARSANPDPSADGGHGVGLKLVRAIALRHGARIRLLREKKGFCIRVIFARAAFY